ncbi:hypothetical protein MANES_15G100200v8 [Manihot esculenta]|uniref:Uncharacterized protein n=1 Tax=Manihot esculenta TaxID=3983 RepID=A0ACB7GAG1_MANES|nr:hypothetical protein MANES_15G100200v8 [Manihot esculenta]
MITFPFFESCFNFPLLKQNKSMLGTISAPTWFATCNPNHRISFPGKSPNPAISFRKAHSFLLLSLYCPQRDYVARTHFYLKASSSSSSVGSAEYAEEPATSVKFQTSLRLPGCSSSLSLLGTGYREKVFAIIGVKVYAAGLYVNQSVLNTLNAWKGLSAGEIQDNPDLFSSIFQATLEKSLQIILVRDVDGKTFWDALDNAISPRIKAPTSVDESALSTFRSIFQGRPLKKGTFIFLTWLDPLKMLTAGL